MLKIATWVVVLTGLVFNISAALVTHFLIDGKAEQLNSLSLQMEKNEKEISLLWLQVEEIERKRETLYILASQDVLKGNIALQFSRLLARHLQKQITVENLFTVDKEIDAYQDDVRNEIDNKFFINIELRELISGLQSEISGLRNWSIFLQMIGLSLILARDLSRRA